MKRFAYILFTLLFITSCEESRYVIKGRYDAAPDGTVVYLSPYMAFDVNDILAPADSAVVRNGRFEFKGVKEKPEVCFVSSSRVIDGGFVVVEPGKVQLDLAERTSRGGTPNNKQLDRFLNEKEKIIAMRGMCEPDILAAIASTESLRDSLKNMTVLAEAVFDMYVSKAIENDIDNALGHFFLTQSVGIASPEAIAGFFELVPEHLRDKMYESRLIQLDRIRGIQGTKEQYMSHAYEAVKMSSVGKKYLDFEMDCIFGGKTLFSEQVVGNKYTVLCFWAAWDKKSLSFLQEVSRIAAMYNKDGAGIVAVSLDSNVEECKKCVVENGLSGIHLCDTEGGSAEVAAAYGVYDLPHVLVINSSGTILLRTATVEDVKSKLVELF